MGLRIGHVGQFRRKVTILIAVFALVAQPLQGLVVGSVAGAIGGEDISEAPKNLRITKNNTPIASGTYVKSDFISGNAVLNFSAIDGAWRYVTKLEFNGVEKGQFWNSHNNTWLVKNGAISQGKFGSYGDGSYSYSVATRTISGAISEFSSPVVLIYDSTKPVATLVNPTESGMLNMLTVQVDATDKTGLDRIVANIYRTADDVLVKSTQTAISSATRGTHAVTVRLPEGTYYMKYNASDQAGNISVTGILRNIVIDTTAPAISWNKQPEAYYGIGDGFHVRPRSEEEGLKKSVYIDEVTPENLVFTSTGSHKNLDAKNTHNRTLWNNLTNDTHVFFAVFEDAAGNKTTLNSNTFVIDRTKPSLKLNLNRKAYVASGATIGSVQNPELEAYDNNFDKIVLYRADGTATGNIWRASYDGKNRRANISFLGEGSYIARVFDTAGNVSEDFRFKVDRTPPTITVKPESIGSDGVYRDVSFKLFDSGKIDKLILNGKEKNLTDDVWSDLNNVKPGRFGAVEGKNNTLVVYDVAGNSVKVTFELSGISVCSSSDQTIGKVQEPFSQFKELFPDSWGMSDHSCEWGEYNDTTALWHGEAGAKWYLIYESTDDWQTTNGQIEGKKVIGLTTFTQGQPIPTMTGEKLKMKEGEKKTFWVHLVPADGSFSPEVGQAYPADAAYTRAWAKTVVKMNTRKESHSKSSDTDADTTSGGNNNRQRLMNVSSSVATINTGTAISTDNMTDSTAIGAAQSPVAVNSSNKEENTRNASRNGDSGQVLGARNDQKEWSILNLLLAISTVIMSLVSLLGLFRNRENGEKKHKKMRVLTLIPAAGAVVLFSLVENISLPMGWVNNWTILMVIIATIQIALVIKARKTTQQQ